MNRTFGTVFKRSATAIAIGATLSMVSGIGFANDANLQKLGAFKKTDTPPPKRIAQGGVYADNLKKMLTNVKMPDGFKIELFAICLLYTSPSPRDRTRSRMPSSA